MKNPSEYLADLKARAAAFGKARDCKKCPELQTLLTEASRRAQIAEDPWVVPFVEWAQGKRPTLDFGGKAVPARVQDLLSKAQTGE